MGMINALQIQFDHLEAELEQLKNLISDSVGESELVGNHEPVDDHEPVDESEPRGTCALLFPRSPDYPAGADCETAVSGCRHFTSVEACYEASVGFFSENARPGGAMDTEDRPSGCSVWFQQHSIHNHIEFNQDLSAKPWPSSWARDYNQICQCDAGSFPECTDGSRLQWYSSVKGYEEIHHYSP